MTSDDTSMVTAALPAEARIYAKRRDRLWSAMEKDSVAIVPTAAEQIRNRDTHFPFRPDSDFYYLTGFPEPDAVAVLLRGARTKDHRYILFCRDRDPQREIWDGRRAGPQGAVQGFGADEAYPIAKLDELLPKLLENRRRIYYPMGRYAEFDRKVMNWRERVLAKVRAGIHAPAEFTAVEGILHELRLIKDKHELVIMRHAAAISAHAHCQAMRACAPGRFEYEIEAELLRHFYQRGSRSPAYPSIVGGGANGCILHYVENNAQLRNGDLLLIDAGAEYQCYASDITRTFPVNGRFSEAQRAVYEVVLAAQRAAIDQVKPGKPWQAPHDAAVHALTRGLVKLGILHGSVSKLIKDKAYARFYMHRTGHWLGMDVHDVGEYRVEGEWRPLVPGMVLTVEPGLYIPAGSKGVAKKWWDIGIRIEDDVVVTRRGNEILTGGVPKTVAEIEKLMGGAGNAR